MPDRMVAEAFPPGDFIKEELEARDWTQTDLAYIMGRPFRVINEVVSGKRGVSPETARGLGDAFGTGAQFWLNLEASYQLYKLSQSGNSDDKVSRRAKLYSKAPINQLLKRNWIETSTNLDVLEKWVCDFFEIASVEQEPVFWTHAARKATSYSEITTTQMAWLFRAKHLSRAVYAESFSQGQFDTAIENLHSLLHSAEEIRHIPRLLSDVGIRFLIVEALPGTRIDGACFWLDEKSPVVVVSLRYDRIDYFWHTIMHELGHVKRGDGIKNRFISLDTDLVGDNSMPIEEKPQHERAADSFAVDSLVPQDELEGFIMRVGPLYSKVRLRGFANLMKVHPGILIGQLQHRSEIGYSANREMLVKVRNIITEAALTDGWGNALPASP